MRACFAFGYRGNQKGMKEEKGIWPRREYDEEANKIIDHGSVRGNGLLLG